MAPQGFWLLTVAQRYLRPLAYRRAYLWRLCSTGKPFGDLSNVDERMLLTGEERQALLDASGYPRTYHDPVLSASRAKYLEFLHKLTACGIIKLGRMPVCCLVSFLQLKRMDVSV